MQFDKPIIPTQANLYGKTGKEALVLVSDELYKLIALNYQRGVNYIPCNPKIIDPKTIYCYSHEMRKYYHPIAVDDMKETSVNGGFFGELPGEQYIVLLTRGTTFETYSFENIFRASDVLGKEKK